MATTIHTGKRERGGKVAYKMILFLNRITLTRRYRHIHTQTDDMYCNSDYDNNSSYDIFWRKMQIYRDPQVKLRCERQVVPKSA